MRAAAALLLGLIVPAILMADEVHFKDTGLMLKGTIHRETDDFIILLVHNDSGQVRIPKSKIARIERSVEHVLEKLAEDDYAGRYKVALWALEKGMFGEAIDVLEDVRGQEGVPKEAVKQLAAAYEQRQQLDKALECYRDYQKLAPEDAELAPKIAQLTQVVNPSDTASGVGKAVTEGLEKDGRWQPENWADANPSTLTPVIDPNTGDRTIFVKSQGGAGKKSAFSRSGDLLNLSDSKEMVFKILLKSPTALPLSVAFKNSSGEFFETKDKSLSPNAWTSVTFSLETKDFKAQKSNWAYNLPLEGREKVGQIFFLVNTPRAFELYVDRIYFTQK